MSSDFPPLFTRLRAILVPHAERLTVSEDTPTRYGLSAPVGPTTLRLWGGKLKHPQIPVVWVQIGQAYVAYHLMPLYGSSPLAATLTPALKRRLHGKTCFNFKAIDEPLFAELADVTARGLAAYLRLGYIA